MEIIVIIIIIIIIITITITITNIVIVLSFVLVLYDRHKYVATVIVAFSIVAIGIPVGWINAHSRTDENDCRVVG